MEEAEIPLQRGVDNRFLKALSQSESLVAWEGRVCQVGGRISGRRIRDLFCTVQSYFWLDLLAQVEGKRFAALCRSLCGSLIRGCLHLPLAGRDEREELSAGFTALRRVLLLPGLGQRVGELMPC